MQLIDGKNISKIRKEEIKQEVNEIRKKNEKIPHLAAIIVGTDPASETYVANKVKSCEYVGFKSTQIKLKETVTQEKLLAKIDELNEDKEIDGFIVQLPLPQHINQLKITEAIDPKKDIDGFHPYNLGKMMLAQSTFIPATPHGIVELIKRYNIQTQGKKVAVIGRSNIVGTPISLLLSRKTKYGNATVTLCHSRTNNVKEICLQSDIIIVAAGIPHYLKANMVKEGTVVIDVGIHRVPSNKTKSGWKLIGDVDFLNVAPRCSHITPVPGGVGLMTIIALLTNTLKAAKNKQSL